MPNFLINVTTKGAKTASSSIKRLSGSLMSLSKVAMVGATGGAIALGVAMKKATSAAAEQELQEKKLTQALGKNADALIKQAGALQQSSRFGDEAIIQQQAYLASIGMSEQQIREMIPVTMDLAAATGMSLESAVKNTAKTLSGMTGELGESVGSLRDLTAEELKAGEGINMMRELFKGAAEGEVKTMAGAMDQAKNAIGDAAEALGELTLPLAKAGSAMTKEFAEKAESAFDALGDIDFGKTFENMKTNMGALTGMITDSFKLAFSMIPDLFRFAFNRILPAAGKVLGLLVEGVKNVGGFLFEPLVIGGEIVLKKIGNIFIKMINFAKEQFNTLATIANKLGADIEPMEMSKLIDTEGLSMANSAMVQLLTEGSQDNIDTFGEYAAAQAEIYKTYADQIIVQNENVENSNDSLGTSTGELGKKSGDNIKKLGELSKWYNKQKETEIDLIKSISKSSIEQGKSYNNLGEAALDAAANVVMAKISEAIASEMADVFASVPFPFSVIAASAVSAAVGSAMQQGIKSSAKFSFAEGGDFITNGEQMIMVGDNPSGRERVQITPLGGDPAPNAPSGGNITLNISAPLVDDTIIDTIIPAINEAVRRGETLASG
jgi:hypothetical protein